MLGSVLRRITALRCPAVLLGSNYLPGLAIRVRRAFLNPGDQRPSSGLKPLRVHRSITGILAPFGIAEHEGFPDPQPLRVRPELFYIRESGPERFGHGIDGPRAALIKTDRPEGCFPADRKSTRLNSSH